MIGSTQQIYLGLDDDTKRDRVKEKLKQLDSVDRLFVFYGQKDQPDFDFEGYETVYVPWPETEMYRTFYPLLGQPYQGHDIPAITPDSLLIVDEMLMTQQRSTLRYNCTHHFLRVSERRMVFNYLPFIDDQQDFMILLDYAYPDRYKMQPYAPDMTAGIEAVRRVPDLGRVNVETTDADRRKYEAKRDNLFDTLGDKDPDTIPRNLILMAGSIKARHLVPGADYVARNRRIKKPGVVTYADTIHEPTVNILDPTHKRRDLIEFMRRGGVQLLNYMATSLPVDEVYYNDLAEWIDRLEAFYDAANIH